MLKINKEAVNEGLTKSVKIQKLKFSDLVNAHKRPTR